MKKNNNKGFTLVELIVVLVILAILAAILVPALLGYIDRARQQQCLTNAQAALVGAQSVAAEKYAKFETIPNDFNWKTEIDKLTDMGGTTYSVDVTLGGDGDHKGWVVTAFSYTEDNKKATWYPDGDDTEGIPKGGWKVTKAN